MREGLRSLNLLILFRCKPAHEWAKEKHLSDFMDKIVLKNNSICKIGNCRIEEDEDSDGQTIETTRCKKNQMDMMEHWNSVFEFLQPSKFKVLVQDNITGAIMIFSLILWVSLENFKMFQISITIVTIISLVFEGTRCNVCDLY